MEPEQSLEIVTKENKFLQLPASVLERFWDKVEFTTDCWDWTGSLDDGYGRFKLNYKQLMAHRVSYELHKGKIPKGLQIDHLCRNRKCVNSDHLEIVTQQENIRRGNDGLYNRIKTHCPAGHEYSGKNLRLRKDRVGRICIICTSLYSHECYRRKLEVVTI